MITSNDIMIKENDIPWENKTPAPIVRDVEIMFLPPGGEVHLELIMKIGTGERNGSTFCPITTYTIFEHKRGVYNFNFEMVKGFMDAAYVMKHARLYLEENIDFDVTQLNDSEIDGETLEGAEEFFGNLDLSDLSATLK
jgi:hypothetical protein